jgi:hypothetical protein
MPYPSPVTYPSPTLYPGFFGDGGTLVAIGGLVLGATDEFGVTWTVEKFEGWTGSPAPTLELTQRARAHGATGSESFLRPRYMSINGLILAGAHEDIDPAAARLSAAVTLDPTELIVAHTGTVRNCQAQRQGEVIVTELTDKISSYSILVVAKDPRKFGDLTTATTRLPFSEGGATYPVTYALTYTGVSGTGVVRVNNPGNTQAPVWLRIDGPVPAGGWTITHQGKQQALTFATSLALAAGEFVTVDMDKREVLAQGQSARAGYVTSRGWFSLSPGDNDIAFSAQNYSSTASLTISTKPAWS